MDVCRLLTTTERSTGSSCVGKSDVLYRGEFRPSARCVMRVRLLGGSGGLKGGNGCVQGFLARPRCLPVLRGRRGRLVGVGERTVIRGKGLQCVPPPSELSHHQRESLLWPTKGRR